MTQSCALYRHFDAAGRLLYVGIAADPVRRLRAHVRKTQWKGKVVMQTIEWLPDRAMALAAEAEAIKCERPRLNVQHRVTGKRAGRQRKPNIPQAVESEGVRAYRLALDTLIHPERYAAPAPVAQVTA